MRCLILTVAVYLHTPSPDDFLRFGMTLEPYGACTCDAYRQARAWHRLAQEHHRIFWASDPQYWRDVVVDAEWREAVWSNANMLSDSRLGSHSTDDSNWWWQYDRHNAARRLRALIGPTNYYAGRLPPPWPED